jgi:hypothetical protein
MWCEFGVLTRIGIAVTEDAVKALEIPGFEILTLLAEAKMLLEFRRVLKTGIRLLFHVL